MLKILALLVAYSSSVLGGFLHGPSVAPAAFYGAAPVAPLPALAYLAASSPPPTLFKYATAYGAPAPTVNFSLGPPVTTTTTTYSGFAAPPSFSASQSFAAPPSFTRQNAVAPPSALYAHGAPPTLYTAPQPYGRFGLAYVRSPALAQYFPYSW